MVSLPKRGKKALTALRNVIFGDPDRFLRSVSGVIHVGANAGQERRVYERHGLQVLWVEPNPNVFKKLACNVADLPKQLAVQALVTDRDGEVYEFHVSNNNGLSSSIFELHEHKDIWPEIDFTQTLKLKGVTLPSLFREQEIDPSPFEALVMDTQGSELLVLQGAEEMLEQFKYVKTEVANFESYANGCQLADIDAFMDRHGFTMISRRAFARRKQGGTYYDVVYQRTP